MSTPVPTLDPSDSSTDLIEDTLQHARTYLAQGDERNARYFFEKAYLFREIDEARVFLKNHCPYGILANVSDQDTFFAWQLVDSLQSKVGTILSTPQDEIVLPGEKIMLTVHGTKAPIYSWINHMVDPTSPGHPFMTTRLQGKYQVSLMDGYSTDIAKEKIVKIKLEDHLAEVSLFYE